MLNGNNTQNTSMYIQNSGMYEKMKDDDLFEYGLV